MRKVVIVTGSRKWKDVQSIWRALALESPDLVVHGGCESGADEIAERWCRRMQVDSVILRAKWGHDIKGPDRSAGPKRNGRMLRRYLDARVLAFPLGGGGTEDCMKQARAAGMTLVEHNSHGEPLCQSA